MSKLRCEVEVLLDALNAIEERTKKENHSEDYEKGLASGQSIIAKFAKEWLEEALGKETA